MLYARPDRPTLSVDRVRVEGQRCDECGGDDVRAYPLLRVSGWAFALRCQSCLATLDADEPPNPFGFVYEPYSVYLREQAREPGRPRP